MTQSLLVFSREALVDDSDEETSWSDWLNYFIEFELM